MTSLRSILGGGLLLAMTAAMGGCSALYWPAAVMLPAPKDPAQFDLPQGKTVLVLVDDYYGRLTYEPFRAMVVKQANDLLVEHQSAAATIPFQNLADLEVKTNNLEGLSIGEIGRRLGADLVVYVLIRDFRLKDDPENPLWHGHTEALVRAIDVNKGVLWPKDRPAGWPIEPVDIPTHSTSANYESQLSAQLATQVAREVAQLFYEHPMPNTLIKRE